MVITHTEFCGLVNTMTAQPEGQDTNGVWHEHKPMKLPINPGDGRLFPWLTGVASRFEKYKFTALTLHYKPTCSTLVSGGVALCPIYDPSEEVPIDRHVLYNAEGVKRGPLYRPLSLAIPKSRLRSEDTMFVRETHDGFMDPNELRMTDLGYFVVTVSDSYDAINYGDLFVTYTIELISPRVGRRAGKCAKASWEGTFAIGAEATKKWPPLGPAPKFHEQGTLMVDHKLIDGSVGSSDGFINQMVFKEPFTGQLTVKRDAGTIQSAISNLIVNGRTATGDEIAVSYPDADQKPRKAKHKWLHTIKDGFRDFLDVIEVVADSGDILELAQDAAAATHNLFRSETTWADLAPAVIDASLLV